MSNTTKQYVLEKISKLEEQIIELSKQIETERKESNEDDTAIKQDLFDKKEMLTTQIMELQDSLKLSSAENNTTHGQDYTLLMNGVERKIRIVHPAQADPQNGYISSDSPLARAIADKKSGDDVSVETPVGVQSYTLV